MVVYRKEPSSPDPVTVSTAAQSGEDLINDAGKTTTSTSHMVPRAILTSRPNSHPFQERHLILDQAIKVGRSVARCRPATSNAIFDCKVLSRNHALLWYENGKVRYLYISLTVTDKWQNCEIALAASKLPVVAISLVITFLKLKLLIKKL